MRIALDDFGTGYATLTQLLSFHLDKIKIDRSFVSRLDKSDDSQVIVRAILGLAKGFGLTTTAEGVEDAAQLASLKAIGCEEGQGYLFSKAIPAAEIPALLKVGPRVSAVAQGPAGAQALRLAGVPRLGESQAVAEGNHAHGPPRAAA